MNKSNLESTAHTRTHNTHFFDSTKEILLGIQMYHMRKV